MGPLRTPISLSGASAIAFWLGNMASKIGRKTRLKKYLSYKGKWQFSPVATVNGKPKPELVLFAGNRCTRQTVSNFSIPLNATAALNISASSADVATVHGPASQRADGVDETERTGSKLEGALSFCFESSEPEG